MSIATEITRLSNAKSALKTSIENKGVSVPSNTKLDGYPALVDQIVAQGYETLTVTCSTDQNGVSAAGQVLTINGANYTVPSNGVVTARIEKNITYSVVANKKDGYFTPEMQTFTATAGQRNITMQWKKVTYGVFILYTDGSLSNYNTKVSGKTPVGVVLVNQYVSFVLHPSEGSGKTWSSNTATTINGVTTTTNTTTAKNDYAGLSNTNYMYASNKQGTVFTFAREASYADGRTGYLPACGEMEQIRLNVTNINTALNLIGGTQFDFSSKRYWCSTQYRSNDAWNWYHVNSIWTNGNKGNSSYGRSVASF